MRPAGLEPATSSFGDWHFIQRAHYWVSFLGGFAAHANFGHRGWLTAWSGAMIVAGRYY
ncbi:hypothetical protein HYW36_00330 [Candidatus Saccharibacteria bacterium]|nr:hypothetical protein [Candidatus Saccharibacteria bacterium]